MAFSLSTVKKLYVVSPCMHTSNLSSIPYRSCICKMCSECFQIPNRVSRVIICLDGVSYMLIPHIKVNNILNTDGSHSTWNSSLDAVMSPSPS